MEAKHWLWSWQIWRKPTESAMDSLPNSAQNPVLCFATQLYLTLCDLIDCSPPGSSVHGDSPGKNTGVGCYALLQGIFPTQESNWGLLHCRWILYQLSYQGSWYLFLDLQNPNRSWTLGEETGVQRVEVIYSQVTQQNNIRADLCQCNMLNTI